MSSKVKIIPKKQLSKLNTGPLLYRQKKLLQCEDSFELSDRSGHEMKPDPNETGYIEFKDCEEWKIAYKELKDILSNREHRNYK